MYFSRIRTISIGWCVCIYITVNHLNSKIIPFVNVSVSKYVYKKLVFVNNYLSLCKLIFISNDYKLVINGIHVFINRYTMLHTHFMNV